MTNFNIPNTLTALRVVLIPVFVSLLLYKWYDYALYVFVAAAATDFFDGLIARLRNQKTKFGKFLDPLADKFILVTAFVLFAMYNFVPKWLAIVVISRDIIIVAGWFILYFITYKLKVEPSILGKLTGASQFILIAYILFFLNFDIGKLPSPNVLIIITAGLTISSGIHYIYRELL